MFGCLSTYRFPYGFTVQMEKGGNGEDDNRYENNIKQMAPVNIIIAARIFHKYCIYLFLLLAQEPRNN